MVLMNEHGLWDQKILGLYLSSVTKVLDMLLNN